MEVRVQITQEDLDKGKPRDPCGCPLARAISRAYPGLCIYVNADGLEVGTRGGDWEDWSITQDAVDFMDVFDDEQNRSGLAPREIVVVMAYTGSLLAVAA